MKQVLAIQPQQSTTRVQVVIFPWIGLPQADYLGAQLNRSLLQPLRIKLPLLMTEVQKLSNRTTWLPHRREAVKLLKCRQPRPRLNRVRNGQLGTFTLDPRGLSGTSVTETLPPDIRRLLKRQLFVRASISVLTD